MHGTYTSRAPRVHRAMYAALVYASAALTLCAGSARSEDMTVGALYSCPSEGHPPLLVRIGSVDASSAIGLPEEIGEVVGISVHVDDPNYPAAQHLPFQATALAGCTPTADQVFPMEPGAFAEGYNQWRSAHGGVFSLSPTEVYWTILIPRIQDINEGTDANN